MKTKTNVTVLLLALCTPLITQGAGRTPADSLATASGHPHELRLGFGDQLFESLVWQNPAYYVNTMPSDWTANYKERYRRTGHWFVQYNYNLNSWLGVGAMVDISGCLWDNVLRNGCAVELEREKNCSFWNLSLMPVLRFWWFHTPYVSMYSSLGAGINFNGGSETDDKGRHTVCAFAFDLALAGVQFNWDRYCAFLELGGLSSLKNKSVIYMLNSRVISLGVGMKF